MYVHLMHSAQYAHYTDGRSCPDKPACSFFMISSSPKMRVLEYTEKTSGESPQESMRASTSSFVTSVSPEGCAHAQISQCLIKRQICRYLVSGRDMSGLFQIVLVHCPLERYAGVEEVLKSGAAIVGFFGFVARLGRHFGNCVEH